MNAVVREEAAADVDAIQRVNMLAFPTAAEAKLVGELRRKGALTLSLVAVVEGEVAGHIAFSPVVCEAEGQHFDGVGLGPMAVLRVHQRRGIGRRLVAEGVERLAALGHRFCVVLGHAEYYPRLGFVRASLHGIRWERPVPDDVFFVKELLPHGLAGVRGVIRYRPEFDAV
jgi:putative acetyltransferase